MSNLVTVFCDEKIKNSATMTANMKEQIKEKIDLISSERLADVLDFLMKIEEEEQHIQGILSFAGAWQDLDQEAIDDLTINLHKNRMIPE